ncbi:SIMPL domain-containing protein [Microcella frigidaquae]|uniref:DUF541 domain-containing protein n=1 Tax=Microcella frigidaquae TaxID=424758 RepID=A0A840X867_9MICO|nr:SIMPL domain-containing protein [Microcella frigidaquae]MBB5618763.1 hypothetical protein [Microcella frigidaquae]NHN44193.1 SIMPL domain-containing protein [Microcella frigidaquae]
MTDLTLTVHGSARAELAPERATVRFTVASDGPERDAVLEAARAALGRTTAALESHAAGSAIEWSVDQLTVTAQRPWTNDGSQAPLVHRASAQGRALTPSDAAAVLVDALVGEPLLTVDGIEWTLTDASLAAARADVRAQAVADAVEAAETLASAVGRPSIRVTALADPGMLDGGSNGGGPQPRFEKAMAMAADAGGGFTLQPQAIVVEAAVDARFTAE